jgi:fibronectin type 3 domain-containing protein
MYRIILIGIILVCFQSYGQKAKSIKLLAKVKSNSILLRWAPTDPTTWYYGNEEGYQIERYTIMLGSKLLDKPIKVVLNHRPIKPKPLESWRADATNNKYSAIAAQAVYGKSFQVTTSNQNNLADIVNQSHEQEQRFSFALFAADQSFTTAKLSGLGLNDSTVKKDERYLYRVFILSEDTKIKIDTALIYIGLKDSVGLTPPISLQAKFGDRYVHLRWPRFAVEKEYTSFIIERAEGKMDFKRINTLPLINTLSKEETHFQAMDSLPQNGIEYQYRVRGITPFGEIGPESERVSGKGFKLLNATASINRAKEEKGKIVINWKISGDQTSITGFYVERSIKVNGKFDPITKAMLNNKTLTYTDETPLSTNYYRVKIQGESNQENFSFPYLAQLADSIPPAPPQGLKVVIDTMGVAKLTWIKNQENDLLGYRVYRSNFASSEYTQLTKDPTLLASFVDTVNLKRLNTKVYYKLVALDKRFNPSPFSIPFVVELPDVIPPLPPSIKSIRSTPQGVKISWNPSASDDVVSYRLLRRPLNLKSLDTVSSVNDLVTYRIAKLPTRLIKWDTIKIVNTQDSLVYYDRTLKQGREYQYSVLAIDKSKRKSPLALPVKGRLINNLIKLPVTDLKATADRTEKSITLTWKYTEKNVTKFLVYRSLNDEPMSLYKSVAGNIFSLKDLNLKMDSDYKYMIKALFVGGNESAFSEPVRVEF